MKDNVGALLETESSILFRLYMKRKFTRLYLYFCPSFRKTNYERVVLVLFSDSMKTRREEHFGLEINVPRFTKAVSYAFTLSLIQVQIWFSIACIVFVITQSIFLHLLFLNFPYPYHLRLEPFFTVICHFTYSAEYSQANLLNVF